MMSAYVPKSGCELTQQLEKAESSRKAFEEWIAKMQHITLDGKSFQADRGTLLLDAAHRNGIELPYDCRAGHCGTCCVRLLSGTVHGGQGSEPDIVHACQCRISSDAVFESVGKPDVRSVEGVLHSLHALSAEVVEIAIRPERALPHHAGQYVQVRFDGFQSRPYSVTLPVRGKPNGKLIWFHVRRVMDGHVTAALGNRIRVGHRVTLTGPYGAAYFRPNLTGRLICVATSTGFSPIWAIATAALREDPHRRMLVIAGGRTLESLYMGPALSRLALFPNVRIVPVCSTPQTVTKMVLHGRPTDFLPAVLPSDVIYACGAPAMVESVRAVAAHYGATCHADPFLPATVGSAAQGVLERAKSLIAVPSVLPFRRRAIKRSVLRRESPASAERVAERG